MQPHDRPAHARRPSTMAQPAIPSAATPSSHQAPHRVLAASRSEVLLASRVPVNRQITMIDAIASMPLARPNLGNATDPASTAATIAPAPDAHPGQRKPREHPGYPHQPQP